MAQQARMLKAVRIDWLQKNFLDDNEITISEAKQILQSEIKRIQDIVTSLPAGELNLLESMELFGLTGEYKPWSLSKHQLYDPTERLVGMAEDHALVTDPSAQNEAYTRSLLNMVLVSCLAQEKRRIKEPASSQSGPESSSRPSTSEPARLKLQFETPLKYSVQYKGERRMVSGFADYTLWHSQESMGTNLVVVEAKRRGMINSAEGQVIAYMGIVHRTRLDEGRTNAVVYGISTDANQYRFWRIDNDSQLSKSYVYEWELRQHREIVSFVRYMIRAAIASSPSTSPIKAGARREFSLAIFGDPVRNDDFDFGFGTLNLDEDVLFREDEILELPDAPSIR